MAQKNQQQKKINKKKQECHLEVFFLHEILDGLSESVMLWITFSEHYSVIAKYFSQFQIRFDWEAEHYKL